MLFLAGGRFDLVRGLRGDGRDEYWERLDVHASYLAGLVTIGVAPPTSSASTMTAALMDATGERPPRRCTRYR